MTTALYIGTEKLDLFEEDNIVIKNSVSKIEDITKVFTATSNSFSVPATDHNNKIFKHYYNASILNPFDARKLVKGAIYLGGLLYKTGNFKLNKVILKHQKATSYSIDFFGLLTELKEILGKDKLKNLDLSAHNFNYTYTNVRAKLVGNSPLQSVANTILSKTRYIFDTNTNTVNTDSVKNLANNNANATSGLDWDDTSSSILNIKIIEAIEAKYSITFSRDFFSNDAFAKLYLLLNGKPKDALFSEAISKPGTSEFMVLQNTTFTVTPSSNDPYTMIATNSSNVITNELKDVTGTNSIALSGDLGSFLSFSIQAASNIEFSASIVMTGIDNFDQFITRTSNRTLGFFNSVFKINENIPDIKIIDYLKGIFQIFKLVVIPTSDSNMYVDTLNNYYNGGVVRDVTKFIDFEENTVSSGTLLNEINYKFKEAQTLLAKQFKINNDIDYGNLELEITDANGKQVDGKSLNFELPFENMVYEKLSRTSGSAVVNVVYGLLTDQNYNFVKVKPHLHYINNVNLSSNVKIIENSTTTHAVTTLNLPAHTLGYTSPSYSTVFGNEINEYDGQEIVNTLYSNYHQTYIVGVFNEKRRSYSFTAKNVSLELIKNLELNDDIVIKGKAYRIDSIDTNIITREIKFNLINLI